MKQRLFASFSGGKTSAYMSRMLQLDYSDKFEIVYVFANTGEEREETLIFADRCDKEWGLNLVWVEAVVHQNSRKACTHKIVNFETASRHGEPYEEVIKKYGIANAAFPHCNRELKLNPMHDYIESICWSKGDYMTAIGIRCDEKHRIAKHAKESGIVYPLIDWKAVDKTDVNDWWEDQLFNLELEEHQGNCKWCWKKSMFKHFRLIDEDISQFDFPARMEANYSRVGSGAENMPRVFFRNHMSTIQLIEARKTGGPIDPRQLRLDLDQNSGCSESCDIFSDLN